MFRLVILGGLLTIAGCECNHELGENVPDGATCGTGNGGGGGTAGGAGTDCRSDPMDGGSGGCPADDVLALEHQGCAHVGQACRSSACKTDICSTGCVEAVCEAASCEWKQSARPTQCLTHACKYPADCATTHAASCAFSLPSLTRPSCVEQQCIEECPGTRLCNVVPSDGGWVLPPDGPWCLSCSGQATDCMTQCGTMPQTGTVTIGDIHCKDGFDAGILALPTTWQSTTSVSCHYDLPPLGWMGQLSSGHSVASFPALGGVCTGRDLFTGIPRTQWSCPACTFVMEGWDWLQTFLVEVGVLPQREGGDDCRRLGSKPLRAVSDPRVVEMGNVGPA